MAHLGDRHRLDTNGGFGGDVAGWSAGVMSIWGKTDPQSDDWLRLSRHLEDSAAVAGALWDHWLPPSVKGVISDGLPERDTDGRILLTWLAGVHDIGKATPGFAVKARNAPGFAHLLDGMAVHGLTCPPHTFRSSEKLPPHCRLGQFVLTRWLGDRYGIVGPVAQALAIPVGAHHGTPPNAKDLNDLRGSQWTGERERPWHLAQSEILDGMARRTRAGERLQAWSQRPPSPTAQAMLCAAVVVADWLASDIVRFPYVKRTSMDERIQDADLGSDLLGPWLPRATDESAEETFARRFPQLARHGLRPVQRAVHDIVKQIDVPALIVLEAPMGVGKTEAALMAAEQLAAKFGCGGVFIGLPTMATSNAMFSRVLDWTRRLESDVPASIFLAHGKARLNEEYDVVTRASTRVHGLNAAEGDAGSETAVVTSWLQGRRKGVLANMVIGTIDQALFGALKSRHLPLRHLALAGKVVIIDEVHAADAYMRRYLVRVLEWLAAYGTPVVLMSATLPPAQRRELVDAYARGRGIEPTTLPPAEGYPVVTIQGNEAERHTVAWTGPTTPLHVKLLDEDEGELVRRLVAGGACVAIIRNTVARAQEAYLELASAVGDSRVRLLHSRFVADDREAREQEVRQLLGPPGEGVARPAGMVVVGTQVLEQSLDIDADVMITDIAPIDLLLQRAGRLHRHQRGKDQAGRPEGVRIAQLLVTGLAIEDGGPPIFDAGASAVYGDSLLLRSTAVLTPHLDGIPVDLPQDIPRLVTAGYEPSLAAPTGWTLAWAAAEKKAADAVESQRSRAGVFRIAEPGSRPTLVGWVDGGTNETDELSSGRAQVRDSEDSLEVLVVMRDFGGVIRLIPGPHLLAGADLGIPSNGPPAEHLALAVAGQSLRLPAFLTKGALMDKVIRDLEVQARDFTGWQQSRWLAGQLVLCLDDDLQAVVAGWVLRYDRSLGLIVSKEEESHG